MRSPDYIKITRRAPAAQARGELSRGPFSSRPNAPPLDSKRTLMSKVPHLRAAPGVGARRSLR